MAHRTKFLRRARRRRIHARVLSLWLLALAAAGCGASGASSSRARPSAIAGAVAGGRVIADSGFRPNINGFNFPNYGNDAGPVNMTPAQVEDLFGPQVCVSGEGSTCRLNPTAAFWMKRVNASMANGHCLGFSVAALRFFTGNLAPQTFGASRPIALHVIGNDPLQSQIAEDFAYQDLPSVVSHAVQGTPRFVLWQLVAALRSRSQPYSLVFFKPDGSGGHAVTPFAVVDHGHGRYSILIYDNNWPDTIRQLHVNTTTDTWHYVGGINPSDAAEVYNGDASTQSLALLPTTEGERQQPCPFCAHGLGASHTVLDRLHYVEVSITGTGSEQPQLLFEDPRGRRTGFIGGHLVNEIPGVQVLENYSARTWSTAATPTFHLPLDHPTYTVLVDGSSLTREIHTQIQIDGAGIVFYIQSIDMTPGQRDELLLPAGDLGVTYATNSHFPASAVIGAQFAQDPPGSNQGRLMTLGTGSIGFAPGSPVTLAIRPQTGTALVSSAGGTARYAAARFVLAVDSAPIDARLPDHYYLTQQLPLHGGRAVTAVFNYLTATGPALPVQLLDAATKPAGAYLVPAHR